MEGIPMHKTLAGALLLVATLAAPQLANAGVYMCEDPVTGKKTFTDKACPTKQAGKKVKIDGESKQIRAKSSSGHTAYRNQIWNSDRDKSLAGRANMNEKKRVAVSVSGNGLLGIDS